MACEAERRPLGVFECQLCSLTAPYSYVGQKPPNTQSIILLEESFVTKDPFTPDKDRFLILGSRMVTFPIVPGEPSRGSSPTFRSSLGTRACGMQPVLLQEVLPPLRPGEHPRLPSGNSAGLGEKESSVEEAGQPAQHSDLSAASTAWASAG
ncbi:cysteine-rich DPF motif domain-containing protein 1 isoform 3-T5 [Glossophaga mutica]